MGDTFRRLKIYLGFVGEHDRDAGPASDLQVFPVRPMLIRSSISNVLLALLSAVIVVAAFDWKLSGVLLGGALGAVLWGAVWSLTVLRPFVPRGTVMLVPLDAVVVDGDRASRSKMVIRLLLVAILCLPLAWLVDRWDLGAVFVPGQLLGMASAYSLCAVLVARWERTHERRALFREYDGVAELYGTDSD